MIEQLLWPVATVVCVWIATRPFGIFRRWREAHDALKTEIKLTREKMSRLEAEASAYPEWDELGDRLEAMENASKGVARVERELEKMADHHGNAIQKLELKLGAPQSDERFKELLAPAYALTNAVAEDMKIVKSKLVQLQNATALKGMFSRASRQQQEEPHL